MACIALVGSPSFASASRIFPIQTIAAEDAPTSAIVRGPTDFPALSLSHPIAEPNRAAIACGMKVVDSELVAIFATDMPFAPKILPQLESALIHDAALPLDSDGFLQPLAGIYRSDKLRSALNTLGTLDNKSVKELIANLQIDQVPLVETELLLDIDTESDLLKAIDLASRLAQ